MRRFNFFDKDPLRSVALAALDVTCGDSGRGLMVLGDGEGHVVFVDRDLRPTAFQAYTHRVNLVHQMRNSELLVTIGDGLDSRPSDVRIAGRAAVLATRERLARDRDAEREKAGAGGGAGGGADGSDAGSTDDGSGAGGAAGGASGSGGGAGGGGGGGGGGDRDLGFTLGLNVPLEMGTTLLATAPDDATYAGYGNWSASAASGAGGAGGASGGAGGGIGGRRGTGIAGLTTTIGRYGATGGGASAGGSGASSSAAALYGMAGGSAPESGAVLKVWRLPQQQQHRRDAGVAGAAAVPECIRSIKLFAAPPTPAVTSASAAVAAGSSGSGGAAGGAATRLSERPVTGVSVSEDLSQVAVGCADGTIILLKGDFSRPDTSASGRFGGFSMGLGIGLGGGSSGGSRFGLLGSSGGSGGGATGIRVAIVAEGPGVTAAPVVGGPASASAGGIVGNVPPHLTVFSPLAVTFLAYALFANPNTGGGGTGGGGGGEYGSRFGDADGDASGGSSGADALVDAALLLAGFAPGAVGGSTATKVGGALAAGGGRGGVSSADAAALAALSAGLAGGGAGGSSGTGGGNMLVLFAVTPGSVRSFFPTDIRPSSVVLESAPLVHPSITSRGGPGGTPAAPSSPVPYVTLDGSSGAAAGCACLSNPASSSSSSSPSSTPTACDLVIGNDDGVFTYGYEDRRGAYAFAGRKVRLAWLRNHLLVVSGNEGPGGAGVGGGAAGGVDAGRRPGVASSRIGGPPLGAAGASGAPVALSVVAYDLRNKFIAFQAPLTPAALGIAPSSGGGGDGLGMRSGALSRAGGPSALASAGGGPGGALAAFNPAIMLLVREWGQAFLFVSTGLVPPPMAPAAGMGARGGGVAAATAAASASSSADAASCSLVVVALREKDTRTKVSTLCSLALFDTAAAVAAAAQWDADQIADIHCRHGQYLYEQGDYDGAMAQYIRTIHAVEPSFVIRQFLDGARIVNLVTYLEELHAIGRATAEHTTLLLNCYTRLKQPQKLRRFITGAAFPAATAAASTAASGPGGSPALPFDVSTAIVALRECGCDAEALYLSALHGDHDAVLAILLDTPTQAAAAAAAASAAEHGGSGKAGATAAAGAAAATAAASKPGVAGGSAAAPAATAASGSDASDDKEADAAISEHAMRLASLANARSALAYIRALPLPLAEAYTRTHGRALMARLPDETSALILDLCVRYGPDRTPFNGSSAGSGNALDLTSGVAAHMAREAAAAAAGGGSSSSTSSGSAAGRTRSARPEAFLPLFIDTPRHLKKLLSMLAARSARGEIPSLSRPLWHALLEVCLRRDVAAEELAAAGGFSSTAGSAPGDHHHGSLTVPAAPSAAAVAAVTDAEVDGLRDEEVLQGLLRNLSADYDSDAALVLCTLHGYKAGCTFLYERRKQYTLVVQHYIDASEASMAAGRFSEARALRREIVRKARNWTETADAAGALSASHGSIGTPVPGTASSPGGLDATSASPLVTASGAGASSSSSASAVADFPTVWVHVLQYLTKCYGGPTSGPAGGGGGGAFSAAAQAATDDVVQHISDSLRFIEGKGLLPPLVVLGILAENPRVPYSLVRDYMVRQLTRDDAQISDDCRTVESLRAETAAMLTECHTLETAPVVFQSRKCAYCHADLDLPAVYFMCGGLPFSSLGGGGGGGGGAPRGAVAGGGNPFASGAAAGARGSGGLTLGGGVSGAGGLGGVPGGSVASGAGSSGVIVAEEHVFHQHCVVEGEFGPECPLCSHAHRHVRDIRGKLLTAVGSQAQSEAFFRELSGAPDGFAKCAEYIGKGVFGGSLEWQEEDDHGGVGVGDLHGGGY